MKFRAIAVASTLAVLVSPTIANAYSECTGKVTRIWTDALNGDVWFWMDTGLAWAISASLAGDKVKMIVASANVAMTTDRTVTARFTTDGVSCTSGVRTDFWGMYLNGP